MTADSEAPETRLGRPFHFMVAFWGERYRDYFVDLFLPSMLAPNNLPLLDAADGHRFYIATPREDWVTIEKSPIMNRIRRHADPIWVEIGEQADAEKAKDEHARYANVLRHMKECFRTLLDAAYHRSSYGSFHAPDHIVSDGMVASMLKSVRAGHHLLLCPVLRQTEETVVSELRDLGLLSAGLRLSETAQELTMRPRVAAGLAVRHLHPEMAVFEEGAKGQPALPPFRYWRMPDGRGLILHSFFALPVLMDGSVMPADHTRCLDQDAFENIYISSNFKDCGGIHVIRDSDEFLILSVTPKAVDHSVPAPAQERQRSSLRSQYEQLCAIRRSMEFYALRNLDSVRWGLFQTPARWHTRDLDEVWMKEERRIESLLHRAVGDYYAQGKAAVAARLTGRPSLNWRSLVLDVPLFELPALARGQVYRFLLNIRGTGRRLMEGISRRP